LLVTPVHEEGSSALALPSVLTDGYLVLCAVLARRLDALLLPRQVLLAGPPGKVGAISFVHGVPESSTVAGVTHAQDKRLRRFLLNQAKLPTPPGITFSSRGSRDVQRFISRYGYPVVLKEVIGENPSAKSDNITNAKELERAISQMRVRSADQLSPARSFVTSAYAESILNLDVDENGNKVISPSARLLIEKSVSGSYIRCLVCDNRVLAAIEIHSSGNECKHVLDYLHQDFKTAALHAASVIPGLSVASIDFVVEDPTRSPKEQAYYVVELCERPRLDSYMRASIGVGIKLADELLRYQANRSSIQVQDSTNRIAVLVRAENLPDPSALLPWLRDVSNGLGLTGILRNEDPIEGVIEGHIEGSPSIIALLLEALMSGVHFGQRATATDVRQTPMEGYADLRLT
jgi:D-alanine-D-alanine ligase-like ATP-grasp enzyme